MEKNELRIGNLVEWQGKIITIQTPGEISNAENFNPIPLAKSEKWLLRVGFKKHDVVGGTCNFILGNFKLNTGLPRIIYKGDLLKHVKCIHQLQNLYFVMEAEELGFVESRLN